MLEALSQLGVHLPTLLIYIINFLLFWGLLYLLAFKPFSKRVRERELEEQNWQAEMKRVEGLRVEAEQARDAVMAEAHREREALLKAAEDRGEQYVRDAIKRARRAAQGQMKRTREELHRQSARAYRDLQEAFVELVMGSVIHTLGRSLDEEEQRKLVHEANQELAMLDWEPLRSKAPGFAIVTTAVPLTDDQQDEVNRFLKRVARRQVRMVFRVEPSVVGGLEIRTGDILIDATLKGRLERLRHHLLTSGTPSGET